MSTRAPGSGRWFAAGYGGLSGFFALDALVREPGTAASLETSRDDQGTTRAIVVSYAVAIVAAPVLRRALPGRLPPALAPAGLGLQAVGLGVRLCSMRALGRAYSRTLRTGEEQEVITTGPYRFVRHPGYAGSLMIWTGFALASGNAWVLTLVGGLLGSAYRRRIAAEEGLLLRTLPSYRDYALRTPRLIPGVW